MNSLQANDFSGVKLLPLNCEGDDASHCQIIRVYVMMMIVSIVHLIKNSWKDENVKLKIKFKKTHDFVK